MTREEILKAAKPILFNTDMVRAIQNGTKTVTRRILKTNKYIPNDAVFGYTAFTPEGCISCRGTFFDERGERYGENFIKLPYQVGDILYVRETWGVDNHNYLYRADFTDIDLKKLKHLLRWQPSIHMPKEAARIFLRVTDVRVERLQDISDEQAIKEGFKNFDTEPAVVGFVETWNSTIKKSDLEKYGWDTNPCVWVIEFERVFENG